MGKHVVFANYFLLLFSQLLFSGWHVLGKYTMSYISPYMLPAMRVVIALPILAGMAYAEDRNCFHVLWRERKHLCLLGVFMVGNAFLFNAGVRVM